MRVGVGGRVWGVGVEFPVITSGCDRLEPVGVEILRLMTRIHISTPDFQVSLTRIDAIFILPSPEQLIL